MNSISLAFSFGLVLATTTSFATGPASAEHDPPGSFFRKYFISPDYVFKEIDYRPTEDRVLNRLIAIETKNPKVQSQIGVDMEGKGWPDFLSCELSPDEKWLWIDFDAGPHAFEPMLFRRVSGTSFEDITSSSDVQNELIKCYPFEESNFFGWKKDSSGVYVILQTRGHVNGVFSNSEVLAFYNVITHHATVLSPEFSIPTDADDALTRAESAKETAQFRKIIEAKGAVEEGSTERDLNLIYNLLKRGLNSEDQQKLVAEEKDWLTTREKKAELDREAFTAERVDVLAQRWLRLTDAPGHTPPAGSPERTAILQATHEAFDTPELKNVVFVVPYLRVDSGWAWIQINPQSADGTQHFESQSGLLQKKATKWTFLEWMPSEEGTDFEKSFKDLRAKYPSAPADIFPE